MAMSSKKGSWAASSTLISSMFWQNKRHPGSAVGLLEVAAGGQRRAAVEDTDVVQSQEAALKEVLAKAVFAVHPPAEVQHQLSQKTA